ncbi:hypothetical protein Q8F55_000197 [Vanrija albida]|uniref:LCCL domain-containing protein n=1 Tax=Vanrija albida TaxID=181172 RepID=A0ABR3QCQ3_9TREE
MTPPTPTPPSPSSKPWLLSTPSGSGKTSPTLGSTDKYADSTGDQYADLEAGEVALGYASPPDDRIALPGAESDSEPPSPWPVLRSRLARLPGVPPVLRVANRILGPTHRSPPPIPSAPLTLALTAGARDYRLNPDGGVARLTRRLGLQHYWLVYLAAWAALNVGLIKAAYYLPNSPEMIGCTATLWPDWPPDTCGLNGTACLPALEAGVYRCPGGCGRTKLGNPRWIGGSRINGRPLVVGGGGGGTYRADSWVCPAAVHAGAISPTFGGCVRVTPLPYPAGGANYTASSARGILSWPFEAHFPAAYTLSPYGSSAACIDYHWPITSTNVVLLFAFTLLFAPPPPALFATLLVGGYAHLVLVSNPPRQPPNWSKVFGGLPAVLLGGYWIYRVSFERTLHGWARAALPLEMALWQGCGFWIGIESSTVFSKVPIQRLGYGALPAGGVVALVLIVLVVVAIVVIQALELRRLGLLRYYLARYLPLVLILIVLANLGHDSYLRPHHYLLCLAAFPVISLPNRISLWAQAFCLGFFLDGVGRWGWDSIVQGFAELVGDANLGTMQPALVAAGAALSWPGLNDTLTAAGFTGVSILLDDMVIAANYTGSSEYSAPAALTPDFSLAQTSAFTLPQANATVDAAVNHYFRIAYIANGSSLDFTPPWTWLAANQSWTNSTGL